MGGPGEVDIMMTVIRVLGKVVNREDQRVTAVGSDVDLNPVRHITLMQLKLLRVFL